MAKYIGLLTTDIRNKLGGVVFSRTQSGTVIRAMAVKPARLAVLDPLPVTPTAAALAFWLSLTGQDNVSWTLIMVWISEAGQPFTGKWISPVPYITQCYNNAKVLDREPPTGLTDPYPEPPPAILAVFFNLIAGKITATAVDQDGNPYTQPWVLYVTPNVAGLYAKPQASGGYLVGGSFNTDSFDFSFYASITWGQLPPVGMFMAYRAVPLYVESFASGPVTLGVGLVEA